MSETYKLYEGVVGSTFAVVARNLEEAEAKYDAYFSEEPCPCLVPDCKCFLWDEDNTDHMIELTTEITKAKALKGFR